MTMAANRTSVMGVNVSARSMTNLLGFPPIGIWMAVLASAVRETRHQLEVERALLEVAPQAGMRRRQAVERQHLLDRVRVAEEHHDFLQVRAAHVQTPVCIAPGLFSLGNVHLS